MHKATLASGPDINIVFYDRNQQCTLNFSTLLLKPKHSFTTGWQRFKLVLPPLMVKSWSKIETLFIWRGGCENEICSRLQLLNQHLMWNVKAQPFPVMGTFNWFFSSSFLSLSLFLPIFCCFIEFGLCCFDLMPLFVIPKRQFVHILLFRPRDDLRDQFVCFF